jgi:hypothetical protein
MEKSCLWYELCQITTKEVLLRLSHVLHYDGSRIEGKVQNLKRFQEAVTVG